MSLAFGRAASAFAADSTPSGITLPEGCKDWRLLSVLQRTAHDTIRAVLGNDVAIKAAGEGRTDPWPDVSVPLQ